MRHSVDGLQFSKTEAVHSFVDFCLRHISVHMGSVRTNKGIRATLMSFSRPRRVCKNLKAWILLDSRTSCAKTAQQFELIYGNPAVGLYYVSRGLGLLNTAILDILTPNDKLIILFL